MTAIILACILGALAVLISTPTWIWHWAFWNKKANKVVVEEADMDAILDAFELNVNQWAAGLRLSDFDDAS